VRIDDVVAALQPLAGHRVWMGEHGWRTVHEVVRLKPKMRQLEGCSVLLGDYTTVVARDRMYPGGVVLSPAAISKVTWDEDRCELLLNDGRQVEMRTDGKAVAMRRKPEPVRRKPPAVGTTTAADTAAAMAASMQSGETGGCDGLSCQLRAVEGKVE